MTKKELEKEIAELKKEVESLKSRLLIQEMKNITIQPYPIYPIPPSIPYNPWITYKAIPTIKPWNQIEIMCKNEG